MITPKVQAWENSIHVGMWIQLEVEHARTLEDQRSHFSIQTSQLLKTFCIQYIVKFCGNGKAVDELHMHRIWIHLI